MHNTLRLNAEIGKNLGLGLIHSQQVVARRAILCDRRSVLGGVVAIVATEAAGEIGVADVDGIFAPR